jgi:hypothetical protein
MNHKLVNAIKMWKGNGNTNILLFSLKVLKILHQERRRQVKTIVMEHFNKSEPANKQQSICVITVELTALYCSVYILKVPY